MVTVTQRPDTSNKHAQRQQTGRLSPALCHQTVWRVSFLPYQLAEFIGQLLDHHAEALQLLKHADQILTGEAADHLQVFARAETQGGKKGMNWQ